MSFSKRFSKLIVIAIPAMALVIFFQNCSKNASSTSAGQPNLVPDPSVSSFSVDGAGTGGSTGSAGTQQQSSANTTYVMTFNGTHSGRCSLVGNLAANENISGSCTMADGTPFSISGTSVLTGQGTYDVKLSGQVKSTTFTARCSAFDSNLKTGIGGWTSSDHGSGTFSVVTQAFAVAASSLSKPYNFNFNGQSVLSNCSAPDLGQGSNHMGPFGSVSITCIQSNGYPFSLYGDAVDSGDGVVYNLTFNGIEIFKDSSGQIYNISFKATIAFDTASRTGLGTWATNDGGSGSVNVSAK